MLAWIDWLIIALYLALSLSIGVYYTRRSSRSLNEYFLGGRGLPWWLAGLSMVATTFAGDTPLAVTELVRKNGVAGNWLWWNMLLGGMLTTFFFARLWRRANIMTDLEFIIIRYTGRAAHFLRGFKAVYQGLFLNALIIGWVNLALMTILQVYFRLDRPHALGYVGLAMLFTAGYAALSGLRGVAVTDAVQFVIAMTGCVVLAVIVVNTPQVGGLKGLVQQVPASALNFLPKIGGAGTAGTLALTTGAFFAFAGIQWWAAWYPGAEPGGGGYVAQRMMSTKTEGQALAATLLFQLLHYAVRPWPWILVGLASLILYPHLPEAEARLGFIYAMHDYLPVGLQGLLLVTFFAAYMSCISSQLNWGTSYLINDLYKPYLHPQGSERSYVLAARLGTLLVMIISLVVSAQLQSVSAAWQFLLECGAGAGLVLILRWYWWRISAWSEIAATVLPFIIYGLCRLLHAVLPGDAFYIFPNTFFITVGFTTVGWLLATYLLPGTEPGQLTAFYSRVEPQGAWGKYARPSTTYQHTPMVVLLGCWLASVGLVYSVLFALGKFLFQDYTSALWLAGTAIACAGIVVGLGRKYRVFA